MGEEREGWNEGRVKLGGREGETDGLEAKGLKEG